MEDMDKIMLLAIPLAILILDKIVALSPCKWDDLIWTSLKKALGLGKKEE